jgi:hypothetical protein
MNITDIKTTQLLVDPINFRTESPYRLNGLTVMSNNPNIVTRDDRGNIILQEAKEDNQLLIIETVRKQIQKRSFLDAVDTNFEYFSFPATIRPSAVDVNINIELDQDPIYARYKPSENRFINAGGIPSGILMDVVAEGAIQTVTNTYYITKEIKNSGADLRIRVKVAHYFLSTDLSDYGTAYFTIMRGGPEKPLNRYYRPTQTDSGGADAYANGRTVPSGDYVFGAIAPGETQNLFIDEIISNSEFEIGDSFIIGAFAGQPEQHTIFSEQTYMVVTDASKNVDEWNQPVE